jgi:hypothetical protein
MKRRSPKLSLSFNPSLTFKQFETLIKDMGAAMDAADLSDDDGAACTATNAGRTVELKRPDGSLVWSTTIPEAP